MPAVDFSQIGSSGLPSYSGYVFDEWMPELQGYRGRRVLREMQDNDAVIGGLLLAFELLIRQTSWTITPGTDDTQGEADAEFIDGCRDDMAVTWQDTVSEIQSFLAYGFSLHELVYKRRNGIDSRFHDGKIGWQGWPMRGQETLQRWEWDPTTGNLAGMHQLGPPDYQPHFIPMEKALLFRTSTKRGNPEGKSLLRSAYSNWYFKKHIQIIESIGIERDLAGLPVARVPMEILSADANEDEVAIREAIFKIVTNIKRDDQEGVVFPLEYDEDGHELYKLELLSTGGRRQFDTDAIIARHEQRMAMSMLGDFMLLGHENVGSNALSQDKTTLFSTALSAYLDAICGVVNDSAIPRLLKLNGRSTDNPPRLEHGDVEKSDLAILGTFIYNLSQSGMQLDTSFDGELMKRLLKEANLPDPPDTMPVAVSAPLPPEPAVPNGKPTEPPPPPKEPVTPSPKGT